MWRLGLLTGACLADDLSPAGSSPFARSKPAYLTDFFAKNTEGPGLWKWLHYFAIYEKHFSRFRGTDVVVAEVGIYSGGSLRMWRSYFGEKATIIGIDISNRTRIYERNPAYGSPDKIFVGDQGSLSFWQSFKQQVPRVDILIDDGGHTHPLQKATLDSMWSHLSPGGVYSCEDLGTAGGGLLWVQEIFDRAVVGASGFNALSNMGHQHRRSHGEWQLQLGEVSFYPYVVVLEKRPRPMATTAAEKHGTLWQPPLGAFASEGASLLQSA